MSSSPRKLSLFQTSLVFLLSLLVFSGLFGLTALQFLRAGCLWWECVDRQPFVFAEVQLPAELFPVGAILTSENLVDFELSGADQFEYQQATWGEGQEFGWAVFGIYRYRGELMAGTSFAALPEIFPRGSSNPYSRPVELTYESNAADQAFVGCRYLGENLWCAFTLRYKVYMASFRTMIGAQMSLADFDRILEYVDTTVIPRLTTP